MNKTIELESRKDWAGLLEHSRRWTKAQPGSGTAWFNLGIAYVKAGQLTKVIEAHQQALRINPEYAKAWNNLGVAYSLSGQRGKVLEVYKRLKALDPALAEHFFNNVVIP